LPAGYFPDVCQVAHLRLGQLRLVRLRGTAHRAREPAPVPAPQEPAVAARAGRRHPARPSSREAWHMRITAAVSRGTGDAPTLEQLEQEEPRAGEMRIRLVATGICHTDLHEHPGRHSPQPIVLGHEGAGVVEKLGEGVRGFAGGDHVILSGNSCGRCPSCLNNRPTYCDLAMPLCFGGKRLDGSTALSDAGTTVHSHFFGQSSFASHAIVPERTAVKMDKDLPLEKLGPLGCGVVTGAGGV